MTVLIYQFVFFLKGILEFHYSQELNSYMTNNRTNNRDRHRQ